jgi:hypothetical protein
MIWFASMKCDEEKVQIEESGFNIESHIEPLCFGGTVLVWEILGESSGLQEETKG